MEKITLRGKSIEVTGNASVQVEDRAEAAVVIRPKGDCRVELSVGSGCRVDTFIIHEKDCKVEQINHVGPGSVVNTSCVWLASGSGRVQNSLEGANSEAYDLHVFVEGGESKLHLDSVLRHGGRDTKGNILVKGIVKDKGAATLDGMIKIEKGGGGAESFLSEHVMLLNPGAHASANPEL
ncbi:MAG: SufD family Fe-S cluster assembly protein, partial [Candidatus Micrarchaeota archaeon]